MTSLIKGVYGLISGVWQYLDGRDDRGDDDEYYMGLYDDIFVNQSYMWDCGIATTSMALLWYKMVDDSIDETPMQFDDGTPLWTIDLYVFLKSRKVNAVMSTRERGIGEVHADISWYREHLDKDRERVTSKFMLAQENSWSIDDAVSTADLAQILTKKKCTPKHTEDEQEDSQLENVAIVLVNINNLTPKAGIDPNKYSGHYILALSFDPRKEEFVYLDPARTTSAPKRVSIEAMTRSRESLGTDEDLIICTRRVLIK